MQAQPPSGPSRRWQPELSPARSPRFLASKSSRSAPPQPADGLRESTPAEISSQRIGLILLVQLR